MKSVKASRAKLNSEGPEMAAKLGMKRRGRFDPAPSGRTLKAYDAQPRLLPWKCSICIGGARAKLLAEEKGRGHLSAKEVNELSFTSKAQLERHFRNTHE